MAGVWTSAAGILIVVWTLREVFTDLFQPSGSGVLSSFLGRKLFHLARHSRRVLSVAGPLSVVIVISSWAFLVTAGFASMYWSSFPQSFTAAEQENRDVSGRSAAVLYFSLASLTTLATGQIAPSGAWVRFLAALESLIGISLVTASVTWIVLLYPALGRMRTLARRASVLVRAQKETGVDAISEDAQGLLGNLAESVIRARVDFIHFPLIYYFQADTEGASLAVSLSQLGDLAERASEDNRPETVRLAAVVLRIALQDLADVLAQFVPGVDVKDPKAVFDAAARDHLEASEDKKAGR